MINLREILESVKVYSDVNFKPENQIQSSQARDDSNTARQIWNHKRLTTLHNVALACIPIVHAAEPTKGPKTDIPKKPPPMKYKDLPYEESNEFYKYHIYSESLGICPDANVKLLHTYLLPTVHKYRTAISESFFGMMNELTDMKNEACEATCIKVKLFKKYMRDPNNFLLRSAVLALGTVTGIYIGSGTRGLTKKFFYGTIGALSSGALCFPKESDELFRCTTFEVAKLIIAMFNAFCRQKLALHESLPCPQDLPPDIKTKK